MLPWPEDRQKTSHNKGKTPRRGRNSIHVLSPSPGWPQTSHIAEDGLELLTLLTPTPKQFIDFSRGCSSVVENTQHREALGLPPIITKQAGEFPLSSEACQSGLALTLKLCLAFWLREHVEPACGLLSVSIVVFIYLTYGQPSAPGPFYFALSPPLPLLCVKQIRTFPARRTFHEHVLVTRLSLPLRKRANTRSSR